MAPKKKSTKGQKVRRVYDPEILAKAVIAVRAGLSVRKAAAKFDIAKSTLSDRVTNRVEIDAKVGRKPALPAEVENKIATNLIQNSERGFGVSRRQLLNRTGILCKKMNASVFKNGAPTKHWWQGLKSRHPELTLRKPEQLGTVRARMLNSTVVERYFTDLGKIVESLNLSSKPEHIWNADETGKQLMHTPINVIAAKGARNVVGRTGNDRTNITIMACANAKGDKMPPMLIVKGKTKKSLYGYNTAEAPPNSLWSFNQKAWMTEELGEEWFRGVFLENCGPERPQLLIMDGHGSHETLGLLELAEEEGIYILALPPHTTHFLQPLDRSVFGPFNKAYNTACSDFLAKSPCNLVTKWTFPTLFKQAWDVGITQTNIISGFRGCGIFPVNKDAIPNSAFAPSDMFDRPVPETFTNAIATATPSLPGIASVTESAIATATPSMSGIASVTESAIATATPSMSGIASVTESASAISTSTSSVPVIAPVTESASAIVTATHITESVPVIANTNHTSFVPRNNVIATLPMSAATDMSVSSDYVFTTPSFSPELATPVISLPPSNAIQYTLPAFKTNNVDDPQELLNLITSGKVDIIATADTDGVAHIPDSALWNMNLDEIFTPKELSNETSTTSNKHGRKSIKTHRLLTSNYIMQEKREAAEKKQKLETKKEERKIKRQEKNKQKK